MKYKYNFSVIIPHKNIPHLLVRCVMSIPQRNDVEIIIVDDNSDSSIVEFDKFPFVSNPRTTVIFDKSNKRQGHARNVGLEHAQGKWIIFIDADDFFLYSINQAMDDCLESDADIIYYKSINLDCESYLVDDKRSSLTNNSIDKFLKNKPFGEDFLRYRHPVPWGKIIRHTLISSNSIKFPIIPKAQDFEFSYLCGYYAKKVVAHNVALCCVTTRVGNVTSTKFHHEDVFITCNEIDFLKFMRNHDLFDSPSTSIIVDDVFCHLIKTKDESQDDYEKICNYLLDSGFDKKYIERNIKRILRAKLKTQIYNFLKNPFKKLL